MFPAHYRTYLLRSAAILACLSGSLLVTPVFAQEKYTTFNIPSEPLGSALGDYSRTTGKEIIVDDGLVRGLRAPAVEGNLSTSEALDRLLEGSGLIWRQSPSGMISIRRATAAPQDTAAAGSAVEASTARTAAVADVVVTGSRIRGAPQASPAFTITADQIIDAGQIDLGEAIRAIPQNFDGGQNPGAGSFRAGANGSGNGYGGQSTLDLRGLGNDATLTLLNGRRLTFSAVSGIDINVIPVAALDRLEIVTDGASALYGSDAVGGVANIITKRDFNGTTVSAVYGGSTDGGGVEQQFSAVTGATWQGGGFIASAINTRNGAITAGERSYTAAENPQTDLYPDLDRFNVFLSAHQDLTPTVHLELDSIYSSNADKQNEGTALGPIQNNGDFERTGTHSLLISPDVKIELGNGWTGDIYGTYGTDRQRTGVNEFFLGKLSDSFEQCLCNTSLSGEASVAGPLLPLPAGNLSIALGAGYRSNRGEYSDIADGESEALYKATDAVGYGFGEIALPLVSQDQHIPLIESLSFSAAARYENYNTVRLSNDAKVWRHL